MCNRIGDVIDFDECVTVRCVWVWVLWLEQLDQLRDIVRSEVRVGICPVTLETRPHQGHDQIFQMKKQPYFRRVRGMDVYTLMYVYMYIYVHVCVYICIFIYISIYIYIHIWYRVLSIPRNPSQVIERYVNTYISICIHIHTCICVYTYFYSYMYVYIHTYMISCVVYSL